MPLWNLFCGDNFYNIISGLFIEQHLIKKGLKLDKIPGFFKFGKYWCFRYTPGILIPIRNRYKEIVNFQVRKDFGKLVWKLSITF